MRLLLIITFNALNLWNKVFLIVPLFYVLIYGGFERVIVSLIWVTYNRLLTAFPRNKAEQSAAMSALTTEKG